MPWKQTGAGQYSRPFDNTDTFFHAITAKLGRPHNREQWAVNAAAQVDLGSQEPSTVLPRLRKAWSRARYHHPFLAATVSADDTSFIYSVPSDAASVERWLDASVFTEQGSIAAYRARAVPKPNCAVHWFPASSELLLRTHHWLVDGMGTIHLLANLLQYYAADAPAPQFGDEWNHLAPGLSEMAGLPEPTPATEAAADKIFADFASWLPPIGLPRVAPAAAETKPAEARRVLLSSSAAAGHALVAACKTRGFSVTSAVHAAMVIALQEVKATQPSPPAENFLAVLVFNYRKYLPPPYDDVRRWPLGNRVLAAPFGLPPAKSFEAYARSFHEAYHQPLRKGETDLVDAYDPFLRRLMGVFGQPPPPGVVPTINPQLTSLGLLEDKMKHEYGGVYPVKLGMVELGVDCTDGTCVLHQWSWQGCFHINANFNTAFIAPDLVEKFMGRTWEVLFNELDVDVDG